MSDIVNGIAEVAGFFASGISDKIFSALSFLIELLLFPINKLIMLILPNFADSINTINSGLLQFITLPVSYFSYHIPPLTRSVLLVYLTIMASYYSIIWIYRGIILIPVVINKIKFW